MNQLLVSEREIEFLLFDWIGIDRRSGVDRATARAVLGLASTVAADIFFPLYRAADIEEPRLADGRVMIHEGLATGLRKYAELGLCGLSFPEHVGGMNLPEAVGMACHAIFASANISATGYTMLTAANARTLIAFGTEAQIDSFARPLVAGEWFGTMCLSEPEAGSALGDIRCQAVADGADALGRRYRLRGNKMWISAADQNVTDNIVHLVLAKIREPDGELPDGTKGISLFIVPRLLPDGVENDVAVGGLNHKMGYRGTANCLLNLGEREGAIGWLVGAEGDGLRQMFKMMNEARIAVGTSAAALAVRSHRHAVAYARERVQGRRAGQPGGPPVPIMNHPDIRRMLLQQKSYAEGALALCLFCAALADSDSDEEGMLLDLLTPVAKSWSSEFGLVANDIAIQVHGGYGYTRDFDVEQLWRDNRLNPIHEGTTGIQAIDLLERKILKAGPGALAVLGRLIAVAVEQAPTHEGALVAAAWSKVLVVVDELAARPLEWRLQDSTQFLRAFGHVVVGWIWLEQLRAAKAAADDDLYQAKAAATRYFCEFELPVALAWLDTIEQGSDLISRTDDALF